jgi:LCP family protein required for cell wall assembly
MARERGGVRALESAQMNEASITSGRHRGHYGRSARRALTRFGQTLAALLSVVIFAAFGYGFYNYRNLTSHQQTLQVGNLGSSDLPVPSGSATDAQPAKGSAQNILIVGLDSRAGLTDAQKRYYRVGVADETTSTDTIIVVHVPADGKKATLLSIPRDTYVQIPGFAPAKINAAYVDGYNQDPDASAKQDENNGATLLVHVVKNLTGLEIDHYVQVGFDGFVNIVKAIGSVPIDLCDSVDDTHSHDVASGVGGGSGFKMSAGHHELTPQEALEFVRQRHNIPGPVQDDLGREARQRYFLKQAFNQIATADVLLNPFKLKHLISAVDSAFTFDSENFGILQFAEQMSQLTSGNITGQSIPITGYATIDGQSVVAVDVAQVQAEAQALFYGSTTPKAHHRRSASTSRSPTTTKPPAASDPAASGCIY